MTQAILHKKSVGRVPLRRCIISRTSQPQNKMIRFIITNNDTIIPDLAKTLPSRGIWITCNRSFLEKAITHSLFTKVAKRSIRADHSMISTIIDTLEQRCLTLLGQIRRAGYLVIGLEDVSNALQTGPQYKPERNQLPTALIQASNLSESKSLKLRNVAPNLPIIDIFSDIRLGHVLGKNSVDHALASYTDLTNSLLNEVQRLKAIRHKKSQKLR